MVSYRWMLKSEATEPQDGSAGGQGALAGLIAGGIGTGAGALFSVIRAVLLGPAQVAALIPPDVALQLQQQVIDPSMLLGVNDGPAEAFGGGAICCAVSLVIGAALGALGGVIFAAVKSQSLAPSASS